MKAHQMRRDVDMHAQPLRFQHGAAEGAGRALAVRARDMDDGRQFLLRVAQIGEQPQDAVQRQVDLLGMKRQQPFENSVASGVVRGFWTPLIPRLWTGDLGRAWNDAALPWPSRPAEPPLDENAAAIAS